MSEDTLRHLSFLALAVLLVAVPAVAQDEELMKVRMSAEAPGSGVSARAAGVQKAEQEVVRQTLEAALALEDMTPLSSLLTQQGKYIRSTQLVRYDTTDAGTKVEVECFIDRKGLLKDAASTLLPRMVHPPSVLILMAEQFGSAGVLDASRAGRSLKNGASSALMLSRS